MALTVAVAALILWLLRPTPRPDPTAAAPTAGHRGYRNRSLLRRTSATAPAERATPTIHGNVYNGDGKVLEGVSVVATTFDRAGNVPAPVGTTKTDAAGRFDVALPPGTYQLNASLAGYGPTSITAQSGDTISMVLPRSGVLQGHVKDENGAPVRRFTIDIVSVVPGDAPAPPPVWSKTFQSEDGSYRADQVPAWPVIVRASADERAPGLSAPVAVGPGLTRDVDLTLSAGCTLTGTVQDKKGNPLPGVLVNAEERVTAGSASDPALQTATQAQSEGDGTFRIEHAPLGTLVVRAYDGDYAVTTATVVAEDCAKLAPVKLVLSKGGGISGVARGADGAPLAGARLAVTDRAIGYVNTSSDQEGRFHFDSIPPGDVRLEMEHEGQRAMRYVGIKDGETTTQDMILFGGGNGEVRGRVTAGTQPIAGARLLVASNHGQSAGIALYFPVTGEDGTFRIPSIPAGYYAVSVMSTTQGKGIKVEAGTPTTIDFDAGQVVPFGDATEHPRTARPAAPPTPSP